MATKLLNYLFGVSLIFGAWIAQANDDKSLIDCVGTFLNANPRKMEETTLDVGALLNQGVTPNANSSFPIYILKKRTIKNTIPLIGTDGKVVKDLDGKPVHVPNPNGDRLKEYLYSDRHFATLGDIGIYLKSIAPEVLENMGTDELLTFNLVFHEAQWSESVIRNMFDTSAANEHFLNNLLTENTRPALTPTTDKKSPTVNLTKQKETPEQLAFRTRQEKVAHQAQIDVEKYEPVKSYGNGIFALTVTGTPREILARIAAYLSPAGGESALEKNLSTQRKTSTFVGLTLAEDADGYEVVSYAKAVELGAVNIANMKNIDPTTLAKYFTIVPKSKAEFSPSDSNISLADRALSVLRMLPQIPSGLTTPVQNFFMRSPSP